MKRKPSSIIRASRCQHRTSTGRQCCSLVSDAPSGLCQRHAIRQKQSRIADHSAALTRESAGFQTAQGINYSLGDLYLLLAQGRISPRRAAVLAQISSLLLRSLTLIDNDQHSKSRRELGAATPPPPALPSPSEASVETEEEAELETADETESEIETVLDADSEAEAHLDPEQTGSDTEAKANTAIDDRSEPNASDGSEANAGTKTNTEVPADTVTDAEPLIRRVPKGTQPLPATIDGFIDAIKKLKPS